LLNEDGEGVLVELLNEVCGFMADDFRRSGKRTQDQMVRINSLRACLLWVLGTFCGKVGGSRAGAEQSGPENAGHAEKRADVLKFLRGELEVNDGSGGRDWELLRFVECSAPLFDAAVAKCEIP